MRRGVRASAHRGKLSRVKRDRANVSRVDVAQSFLLRACMLGRAGGWALAPCRRVRLPLKLLA